MCGRRSGTGSCVSVRQTTTLVVRGLGRAFLCLSVCLSVCLCHRRPLSAPEHASGCPKLRPASANQPLGPRWHPGNNGRVCFPHGSVPSSTSATAAIAISAASPPVLGVGLGVGVGVGLGVGVGVGVGLELGLELGWGWGLGLGCEPYPSQSSAQGWGW